MPTYDYHPTLREQPFTSFVAQLSACQGEAGAAPVDALTINVVRIDSTHIRIEFSAPVVSNPAMLQLGNYATQPQLEVRSVLPEPVSDPTYVILETSEQRTGINYAVFVYRIEAA